MLDSVEEYLQKADEDLYAVDVLIGDGGVANWIIGFHCQQAAEKILKAILASKRLNPPKTHDLFRLIQMIEEGGESLPDRLRNLDLLNPFAVLLRYETLDLAETFDPLEARRLATELRAWTHDHIR